MGAPGISSQKRADVGILLVDRVQNEVVKECDSLLGILSTVFSCMLCLHCHYSALHQSLKACFV